MMNKDDLRPGMTVSLNQAAREHFRGYVLHIEEVKSWGVTGVCYLSADDPAAEFPYRAAWEEIEGLE